MVNHICSSMSIWVFIAQSTSKFPLPQSSDVTDPTVVLTIYSRNLPEKSHPLQHETWDLLCHAPTYPLPLKKKGFKKYRNTTKCKLKYSGSFPCTRCKGSGTNALCYGNHEQRILVVFTCINVISQEFRSHSTLKTSWSHWSQQVHCTYKHRPGLKAGNKTVAII